eukprot:gene7744-9210_t
MRVAIFGFATLGLCLAASTQIPQSLTHPPIFPPKDWQHGISTGDILFGPRPTKTPELMPSLANGYVGTIPGVDNVYLAGIYCKTSLALIFPGSQRCRIPVPAALSVSLKGAQSAGVALDIRRGLVMERLLLNTSSAAVITQRWYAHRSRPSLLVSEIVVNNTVSDTVLSISLDSAHSSPSSDIDFKETTVPAASDEHSQKFLVVSGAVKHPEDGDTVKVVAYAFTPLPTTPLQVPARTSRIFTFISSFRTTLDSVNPAAAASDDLARGVESGALLDEHVAAWSEMWSKGGVEVDNATLGAALNSSLYYMLSSVREGMNWPVGPGGLPTNGYWGNGFWDNDMWAMPSLLPWWPELSRVGVKYRVERIPEASMYARKRKAKGLLLPWQTASTGKEVDLVPFANVLENHVGGDVALLLRNLWDATHDAEYLANEAAPLAYGICDYYVSIAVQRGTGSEAHYSIEGVVPPDEYAIGFPIPYSGVNDAVFTNAGASLACSFAASVAQLLNATDRAASILRWTEFSEKVLIATENIGTEDEFHPEYRGYPHGNRWMGGKVKQADAVLLGFPLDWRTLSAKVRRNDLLKYEPVYDPKGPAMTASMHTVGWLELNETARADQWFQSSQGNMQPPFAVWTESKEVLQHKSLRDEGCYNFLTGAGGFIQSVVYGYGGLRYRKEGLYFKPTLLEGASWLTFRGVNFRSGKYTIFASLSTSTICVQKVPVFTNHMFILTRGNKLQLRHYLDAGTKVHGQSDDY